MFQFFIVYGSMLFEGRGEWGGGGGGRISLASRLLDLNTVPSLLNFSNTILHLKSCTPSCLQFNNTCSWVHTGLAKLKDYVENLIIDD